jgi:hypothetical protein
MRSSAAVPANGNSNKMRLKAWHANLRADLHSSDEVRTARTPPLGLPTLDRLAEFEFQGWSQRAEKGKPEPHSLPQKPRRHVYKVVISMTPEFYVRTFEHHAGTFNRVEVAAGTWMGRAHVNDPRQGGEVATCHCDRGIIEGRGSWEGLPLLSSVDRFHSDVCPDHNIVKVANSLSQFFLRIFQILADMAAAIPSGGTLLDTFKKSFTDVPVDAEKNNAIHTAEFLDASESLTTMFGRTYPRPLTIVHTMRDS